MTPRVLSGRIKAKTGSFAPADVRGLLELARRWPEFRPLLLCAESEVAAAERSGVAAMSYREFLLKGPPDRRPSPA